MFVNVNVTFKYVLCANHSLTQQLNQLEFETRNKHCIGCNKINKYDLHYYHYMFSQFP